ncbi:MAG: Asp-tRNA(Asn)/Glu-tRNA(Gln) amidotransferase subunit GatA [Clostridiales bacterium]|nr:Asp-tRNA(Asn)/Glu-tRNA(Gln) amidotransferase subunit GatA [Clostridiales bacterium]
MSITDLTLRELIDKVESGELTKKEIFKAYNEKIKEVDDKVNAYLSVENEIKDAFPIAIKDNINVMGTYTTAASKFLQNYKSPYNAEVIEKLEKAGFKSNGKVNMDEFAFGTSTEYSALKETSNPVDYSKVPGGSSGGSAAAVAANMAPVALGTDTGGSVRQPANYCGVVGFKPSYGMISRYGVISFGSSLDQVGIVSKDVYDSALMLNVLQGTDGKDTTAIKEMNIDFTKNINNDLKGKKIAVIDNFLKDIMQEEVKDTIENTINALREEGAEVDRIEFKYGKEAISVYHIISSAEASSNLSRMDGIRYGVRSENSNTLEDLYVNTRTEGIGREAKRRIMLGTYVLSAGFYDAYYKKALKVRELIIRSMNEIFEKYDAILMPVTVKTAPKKGYVESNKEETFYSDIYTCLANITGTPAISIPVGKDNEGMPIGMQFITNRYEDEKLLNISNVVLNKMKNNF